jgi:hypothetical protein
MTDVKKPDVTPPPDAEAERLRGGIEQTRAGMSATITALETRLNPGELRGRVGAELEHVEAKVRDVVREHLAEAKTLVKEELVEAKNLLRGEMNEAESKIKKGLTEARDTLKEDLRVELDTVEAKLKNGLAEARDTVKNELHVAFEGAKHTVRAATLGKVEDIATNLGDTMNDTRDTLVDTIRNNPLPAALTGLGLVWLLMNRSKSARSNSGIHTSFDSYGSPGGGAYGGGGRTRGGALDGARHALDQVGSAVGGAAHRASETAGHLAHDASSAATEAMHQASDAAGTAVHGASEFVGRVASQTADAAGAAAHGVGEASTQLAHRAGDAAAYVAGGARSQARRVEQGLHSTLHESPLALGAAALAVGAAVGFSLPRTQVEDQLMGETRDTAIHRAEGVAHDAAVAIGHLGEKTAEAVKQTVGSGAASS